MQTGKTAGPKNLADRISGESSPKLTDIYMKFCMNAAPAPEFYAMNNGNISYRPAKLTDVDAIVALVNSAYRGPSSRAGWTTEADLLDGQRTDAEEISRLVGMNSLLFFVCCSNMSLGSAS